MFWAFNWNRYRTVSTKSPRPQSSAQAIYDYDGFSDTIILSINVDSNFDKPIVDTIQYDVARKQNKAKDAER